MIERWNEDDIVIETLKAMNRRAYHTFDTFMYCGVIEGFKRSLMLDIRRPIGFLAWENVGITIKSMYGVLEDSNG
jgi:hypothetical protein